MISMRAPDSAAVRPRLSLTLHRPRPGQILVRALGELDLGSAVDLRTLLRRVAGDPDPATGRQATHIVCDLTGVTFLSAAGVGTLAEAGDAARRRDAHFGLVACTRPVLRVLDLCRMDLPVSGDVADALHHRTPETPAPRSAP